VHYFRQNRVAITGLGVIAPNGIGLDPFWSSLCEGKSAITRITRFDASQLKSQIAGEVKNFDPAEWIHEPFKPKRLARHTQLALVAARMAIEDSELIRDFSKDGVNSIPVIVGLSIMDLENIGRSINLVKEKGPRYASANTVFAGGHQSVASAVAELLKGPTEAMAISTACASGLDAIGHAFHLIATGRHDVAIAGGTEAPIASTPFSELVAAGLCSTRNHEPEKASRPFDADRDSGVVSEGAGFVVLENLESALSRGVPIYAEITGYAMRSDDNKERPGCGFAESMRNALHNASRLEEDVDYISAWGPGHPIIDRIETEAIKEVFGPRAYSIPVSSIKGVVGNPLGAAGAIQAVACAMTLNKGMLPPTANLEKPDAACDLDYVPLKARRQQARCALINSHGVGGANSTLVMEQSTWRAA
jgi:3-oxoacyl-[acyl-carrier-protein] synthase II